MCKSPVREVLSRRVVDFANEQLSILVDQNKKHSARSPYLISAISFSHSSWGSFSVSPSACLLTSGPRPSLHPTTIFGSTLLKQGKIESDTVTNCLSGLSS